MDPLGEASDMPVWRVVRRVLESVARVHYRVPRMSSIPKGPCTQIAYTLAPKDPNRDYFKAKVYLFGYMDP